MTDSTLDMLTKNVEHVAETIAEYARQIESGEYGNRWTVQSADDPVDRTVEGIIAATEDEAITIAESRFTDGATEEWVAERDSFDEPTICDENGNTTPIDEWPLAVVVKIGRPLAVQITVGGPHIEIVQDLSDGRAKLAGYWGGEKVYRYGDQYQTVLDYFTDALWDEAPEEYK